MCKFCLNKNIDNVFMTTISTKIFMFTFAFSDSKDIKIYLLEDISPEFPVLVKFLCPSPRTAV